LAMTTALVNRAITTNTASTMARAPKPCRKSPAASSSASSTVRTVISSEEAVAATSAGSVPSGTVASHVSVTVPREGPSTVSALSWETSTRELPPKPAPSGGSAIPTTDSGSSCPEAEKLAGTDGVAERDLKGVGGGLVEHHLGLGGRQLSLVQLLGAGLARREHRHAEEAAASVLTAELDEGVDLGPDLLGAIDGRSSQRLLGRAFLVAQRPLDLEVGPVELLGGLGTQGGLHEIAGQHHHGDEGAGQRDGDDCGQVPPQRGQLHDGAAGHQRCPRRSS